MMRLVVKQRNHQIEYVHRTYTMFTGLQPRYRRTTGLEPANNGVTIHCLTTWLRPPLRVSWSVLWCNTTHKVARQLSQVYREVLSNVKSADWYACHVRVVSERGNACDYRLAECNQLGPPKTPTLHKGAPSVHSR